MRKLVFGALTLSAAMAVAFGANVKEADAAIVKKATLEGDTLTMRIKTMHQQDGRDTEVTADEVFVGTASLNTSKKTIKVSAWDYYKPIENQDGVKEVRVDLSKLAITKDAVLAVKADFDSDDEAVLVKIPASPTLAKGKIAAGENGDGVITALENTNKNCGENFPTGAVAAEKVNLVYYTDSDLTMKEATGLTIPKADFALYQNSGATVYIRDKGTTVSTLTPADSGYVFNQGKPVNMITLGYRPSKAFKLSVAKLANAPKLKVDYVKGIITVSKNLNYKVGGEVESKFTNNIPTPEGEEKPDYYEAGNDNVVLNLGQQIESTTDFYVDVQTAASGTKAASKWGRTVFRGQEPLKTEEIEDITAKTYWTSKGYGVEVLNNSLTKDYAVRVKDNGNSIMNGTKEIGYVAKVAKRANANKAATSKKIAVNIAGGENNEAIEAALSKLTVEVQALGDAKAATLPTTKSIINVTPIYYDDEKYAFDVTNQLGGDYNVTVEGATANDGDDEENSTMNAIKGKTITIKLKSEGKIADKITVLDQGKIERGSTEAKSMVKLTPMKATAPDEAKEIKKNDIIGYTFKMPASPVTIKKAS